MDDNLIGEYIRRKRKEAGYSQKEFAFLSGLGFRFVQELERGKQTVRLDKVNQALKMLALIIQSGNPAGWINVFK